MPGAFEGWKSVDSTRTRVMGDCEASCICRELNPELRAIVALSP